MENQDKIKHNQFCFHSKWWEIIKDLPDSERLEIYDAVMDYAFTGGVRQLTPIPTVAFTFIRQYIDIQFEKTLSEKRREAGIKGAKKRWSKQTEKR